MDWNYELQKDWYYITLENGKKYRVKESEIDKSQQTLGISVFEAIEMWLEDNDILINDEVEDLTQKAKANGSAKINAKTEKPKQKTQRERVVKENPTKELIITTIANALESLDIINLNIENKAKLITFSLNNEDYKVDLVQKRKKKEEN